ncbi:iron ABC transporter [Actibacterium mucosum KCTC 23349]|uniref:Iron ABC transporter n=1 Tax=Actibacterium mucosum KCTC 23349 TaxID=1454373 RepID=A0A037ZJM6_9RHOB|nr:ABC transporter ATP-binding protein [Actibacterium mucosum]KAJ55819.1 iron ABC transporter [Actibacterium mucosum KCTC 23349]
MPSDPALTIENLAVHVGGKPYVRDVSLTVPKGQIHGLIGPNGAGKTSLLRAVYRAERPVAGNIAALGHQLTDTPFKDWAAMVGALVQSAGLLAGLTATDIVEIGLAVLNLDPDAAASRRDAALDLAGLTDKADQPASALSGGELQRCYFAQLLARDPDIYILDEPTNHLDLHYQLVLLDEVQRRGKTVLMTLHDLDLVRRYCDRVYLMSHGQIVDQGAPDAVISRENLKRHYMVNGEVSGDALRIEGPVPRASA